MHKSENKNSKNESVALVGMPGSGKSSIGRFAAKQLGYDFIDSDELIEKKAGSSIPEIFANKGEPFFRALEKEVILHVLEGQKQPYILSTGGGAIMTVEIKEALLSNTYLIFLDASLETLWSHVADGYTNRPLLNKDNEDPKQKLKNLLEKRLPVYKQAHKILNCDHQDLNDMIHKLVKAVSENE